MDKPIDVCVCVCVELAHMTVETGKSKICREVAGCRCRAELMLQVESEGSLMTEIPLLWGTNLFLLRPSTDLARPTQHRA